MQIISVFIISVCDIIITVIAICIYIYIYICFFNSFIIFWISSGGVVASLMLIFYVFNEEYNGVLHTREEEAEEAKP